MKAILFLGLVFGIESFAADLRRFAERPSLKDLPQIQSECRMREVSAETLETLAKKLVKTPNEAGVRALITFRQSCSDGAFSEDLNGILGVEILLQKPSFLIQSLVVEKVTSELLFELAAAEGRSGESPFIDCDYLCIPKVITFFGKKASAIRSAKGNSKMKNRILESIEQAKKKKIHSLSPSD